LRSGSNDNVVSRELHVRIIARDSFTQSRYSGLQSVPALFLLNDSDCFANDNFRRRQVRFTESETDAARLCAIRNFSDHAFLNAAQKWWWLELVQGAYF